MSFFSDKIFFPFLWVFHTIEQRLLFDVLKKKAIGLKVNLTVPRADMGIKDKIPTCLG